MDPFRNPASRNLTARCSGPGFGKRIGLAAIGMLLVLHSPGFLAPVGADLYDSGFIGWNWSSVPGQTPVLTHTFSLPEVSDIGEISIDLAHTWGNDFRPVRLDGPGGASFVLLNDTLASNGLANFDLGLVEGSGAPANLAPYQFTQAGPSEWIWGFSPPGEYNAVSWSDGPFPAGQWTLTVQDPVTGGEGAVGHLRIEYTGAAMVPEPGSAAMLLGLVALGLARRRSRS
jgi:hypothetical protein